MIAYHIIEFAIVAGAVGFSLWNLAKRFLPQLRGKNAAGARGGCASCDSCGSCGTPSAPQPLKDHPIRFHRD